MVVEQEREMEDKLLLRRTEENSVRSMFAFCFHRKICIRANEYLMFFFGFGLVKKRTWCYNRDKFIQLSLPFEVKSMETASENGVRKHGLLHMLKFSSYHGQGYCFWSRTNSHPFSTCSLLQSQHLQSEPLCASFL